MWWYKPRTKISNHQAVCPYKLLLSVFVFSTRIKNDVSVLGKNTIMKLKIRNNLNRQDKMDQTTLSHTLICTKLEWFLQNTIKTVYNDKPR